MLTSVAAASVSTAAPVPTVAATTTTAVSGHLSQAGVNLLLGLLEDIHEITSLLGVYSEVSKVCGPKRMGQLLTVSGEEGDGGTHLTSTASTANTVDVILRVVGVVIVQHVSNVANILNKYG